MVQKTTPYTRYHLSIVPWIVPIGLLVIWNVISEKNLMPAYLLPHPKTILKTAFIYLGGQTESAYAGRFLLDFQFSLFRVILGFGLASLIGIPLGLISGRVPVFNLALNHTIDGLRAIPGISLLPLALVWFGIGLKTTVFLISLAAFFPVYLNTTAGVSQINPLYIRSGRMMGLGIVRSVHAILLPAAAPQIVIGLRLGLGISWAYLVLGELTGAENGLGAVIMDARMVGRIDMIIVGIILIAFSGRISDLLLQHALRFLFKSIRRIE